MSRARNLWLLLEPCEEYDRQLLAGIVRYAREKPDWTLYVHAWKEAAGLRREQGGRPDGVISRCHTPAQLAALRRRRLAIVNVSSHPVRGVPQVCRDGHAIGRMAAEHFLECGLRNFAFRGDRPWEAHLLRAEGFMERVREAGFTCAYSVLPSRLRKEWSWKREISDLARFIRGLPLPAGVMAVEAIIGRHILQTCRILRLRVPEDLAVVGGVDDELTCLSCRPQLSSVALGADRVGWEAAALLDRILGGAAPPKKPIFIPPIRLMVRQSSDVLAIETPRLREAVRFIRAHACEGLVVKEVLARLSVSRRWLEQQFRKRLHRTPREEIRRVQAGRAKQLLAGTNHSMSAIAAACGYPNAMRFSANFRRAAGLSPTAYRRMSSRSFGASPKR